MLLFFLLLAVAAISTSLAERACNNSSKLCSAAYDQVIHLGAHDSPFFRDASTGFSSFGNQIFSTTVQLDAGVRLLTAQVHVSSNPETKARELHLCHSSCALFNIGPVHKWLWEIRIWLDEHPDEVVTLVLVNMDFVDARELEAEYLKADLAHYGYVPPTIDKAPPPSTEFNLTWPTLGQMIDKGERLVSFVNALVPNKENTPYLLNQFDFICENKYDVTDPNDFGCTPDRPSNTTSIEEERDAGKLFMMNHLLYWQQAFGIQIPDARKIADTNSWDGPGGLGTHMIQCGNQVARQPTFVLVDFFNVGPAIDAVDIFNGVRHSVGRRNVTSGVVDGSAVMKSTAMEGLSVRRCSQ
ncbi:Nn.00g097100.m01.CDS01 [Neocucurbitaria sp. VM-36]